MRTVRYARSRGSLFLVPFQRFVLGFIGVENGKKKKGRGNFTEARRAEARTGRWGREEGEGGWWWLENQSG